MPNNAYKCDWCGSFFERDAEPDPCLCVGCYEEVQAWHKRAMKMPVPVKKPLEEATDLQLVHELIRRFDTVLLYANRELQGGRFEAIIRAEGESDARVLGIRHIGFAHDRMVMAGQ